MCIPPGIGGSPASAPSPTPAPAPGSVSPPAPAPTEDPQAAEQRQLQKDVGRYAASLFSDDSGDEGDGSLWTAP